MSEKYRPSNGTEGMLFMSNFCDNCKHMPIDPDAPDQCEIQLYAMAFGINKPEYPKEWIYKDGEPTCTAFKRRV